MALHSSASFEANPITTDAVIENEIPTYRAISPLALASAGFGALSALAFTAPLWFAAPVLAFLTGFWAERKIRMKSDVLTGRSFAQAGIALGLIFGISALSYTLYSNYIVRADARKFGLLLESTLNHAKDITPLDTSDLTWFMIPPSARKGLSPDDAKTRIQQMTKNSEKYKAMDDRVAQMLRQAGKQKIEFVEVESAFFEELDPLATILFKVGDEVGHTYPEGDGHDHKAKTAEPKGLDYALFQLRGQQEGRRYKWSVDDVFYPYARESYKHVAAKKDDGHGH